MTATFVAIDVETANANMASICQIGVAEFCDGKLANEWSSLVNPEDCFHGMNISIHGIQPAMVEGQPTFPQVADQLRLFLGGSVSVCHTHFDRLAINRALTKYALQPIETSWLDSARVARRTWNDLANGYGLSNVCKMIGYEFNHHDALEDAKAAGHILLAAIKESQHDLNTWLLRVTQPIDPTKSCKHVRREGNPKGGLLGEVVVFTGTLEMLRAEAADLASSVGCDVRQTVTKKTTLLVVGDQDITKLAGHEKSSKHRMAEQLMEDGVPIRIIQESDFSELVRQVGSEP